MVWGALASLWGGAKPEKKEEPTAAKLGKSGKKICCSCPETRKPRDECVVMFGEEHPECKRFIEAHKACLRSEGFDV